MVKVSKEVFSLRDKSIIQNWSYRNLSIELNNNIFTKTFTHLDFTLSKYEELCQAVGTSKYSTATLAEYLQLIPEKRRKPYIIMRHDIDRSPKQALDVARVEQKYAIKATYYFRAQRATFVPNIIDEIASYGHEIGYHYETVDKCHGNMIPAIQLFADELSNFRKRYDVKTVCAHGNPLTKNDNKDIWKDLKLSDYGLLGEAFLALDYSQFAYFSDSGRTWVNSKIQKMPGKDSVQTSFMRIRLKTTNDLIQIIKAGVLPNINVLVHTERWSRNLVGFIGRLPLDLVFNWGKVAIYTYRRMGRL